jgi:hypothetical protein
MFPVKHSAFVRRLGDHFSGMGTHPPPCQRLCEPLWGPESAFVDDSSVDCNASTLRIQARSG